MTASIAIVCALLYVGSFSAMAQVTIRQITVNHFGPATRTSNEGDSLGLDPRIPALANRTRIATGQSIIDAELIPFEGDEMYEWDAEVSEENLRNSGLFSKARVLVDTIDPRTVDFIVNVQDKWSTIGEVPVQTGGGIEAYGFGLRELNGFGTGIKFAVHGLHRTEHRIGWQGSASIEHHRLPFLDLSINTSVIAHRFRTAQSLTIQKPFRNRLSRWSMGGSLFNHYGSDFVFTNFNIFQGGRARFSEERATAWIGGSITTQDQLYVTALISGERINREYDSLTRRAFDNGGRFLLGFSSLTTRRTRTVRISAYETEDVATGAWGTAVIGHVFAMGPGGLHYNYIGGQAEQSAVLGNVYLFAQVTAGSAFRQTEARYTYQEFRGQLFWRISPELLLASRLRQQSAWTWDDRLRQLVLDNDAGLRGYQANELVGRNRIVGNLELRASPGIELFNMRLSSAAFWDFGTVWNPAIQITQTQFHHALGGGIRFHGTDADGGDVLLRIDLAYNMDRRSWPGIILSTSQAFNLVSRHEFKLPTIFGNEFEME